MLWFIVKLTSQGQKLVILKTKIVCIVQADCIVVVVKDSHIHSRKITDTTCVGIYAKYCHGTNSFLKTVYIKMV